MIDASANQVRISDLRIDPDLQPRAVMDGLTVWEYRQAMEMGSEFPPVVVFFDSADRWLADGFHRVEAAKAAGHTTIRAKILDGGRKEALLHSVGANATHGLRRSNADKRRAVRLVIGEKEWSGWSDRKIAKHCGVTHPFVAKVKAEVSGNGYHFKPKNSDVALGGFDDQVRSLIRLLRQAILAERRRELDESDRIHVRASDQISTIVESAEALLASIDESSDPTLAEMVQWLARMKAISEASGVIINLLSELQIRRAHTMGRYWRELAAKGIDDASIRKKTRIGTREEKTIRNLASLSDDDLDMYITERISRPNAELTMKEAYRFAKTSAIQGGYRHELVH